MGWRAADGIADAGVDGQVEVRAVRTERIAIANSQFIATLPPAMLADDDTRIELFTEARPGPHSAGRGAHINPISIPDAACRGRRGIQLDLRIQCALAQARQRTMLGLTKQTGLRARQDQREGRGQVGAGDRADGWFDKVRHGRIAVIKEGLGPEFDFPRGRREAARVSLVVARGVLGVLRRQRFPQSGRLRSKLFQGDAARTKLLTVSGIDITVPEMLAKAETRGKAEDDIGIGPCLAGRGDDGLPKLNVRLRICADFESDLESFAFEAGRHRQHDIRKRRRRRHEQIGMGVKIERGQRGASANRIAVSKQQICAEPDEPADGIGVSSRTAR